MKCKTGKVAMTSKRQAEEKMRAFWRTPKPGKVPVRVYHCPLCTFWHMTSKPLTTTERVKSA